MKNFIFTLAFMLIGSFAFANNIDNNEIKKEKPKTEIVASNSEHSNKNEVEDDALRCKVSISDGISTVTMSCWFCNCKELAEEAEIALLLTQE